MPAERSRAWDVAMMVAMLGSVAMVFWYEAMDPARDATLRRAIEWVDLGLVVVFLGDWVWRVKRSGPDAKRYAMRNAWELLGMVPIIVPFPPYLRALRLLRVLRILRLFGALGRQLGFWQRVAKEGRVSKIAIAAGAITLAGAVLVWAFERQAAPGTARIDSFGSAMWWAVVTVATVGYGDYYPVTTMGRFVAAVLMMTGIGTIGLLASSLASVLVHDKEQSSADGPASALPLPSQSGVLAGQLAALAQLHEQGKLSDAEFAAAKARVLGLEPGNRPTAGH